jgi:hypothetical protein
MVEYRAMDSFSYLEAIFGYRQWCFLSMDKRVWSVFFFAQKNIPQGEMF